MISALLAKSLLLRGETFHRCPLHRMDIQFHRRVAENNEIEIENEPSLRVWSNEKE